MHLPRHRALSLLAECNGDEIWSREHCEARGLPQDWINELADAFESGFNRDDQTIYTDAGRVNQYHGVRDVDLAIRLAQDLGVRVSASSQAAMSRRRLVQAIKDAVAYGEDEL
ncbi:MAG: hypothetical protein AAF802_06565 [Planctomycetota bacterium]